MAKIIKKPSALYADYLKIRNTVSRAIILALFCIIIAIIGSVIMKTETLFNLGMILTCTAVLTFLICIVVVIAKQNDLAIKHQGVLGEDTTADILNCSLDNSVTVFQNCVITLDGKCSETDLIVVGANGVFIIEAKNRNGTIEGSYKKERWTQHKTGYKGGKYSTDFYSPVKQVSTHIFRLAGFLRQNGIRTYINGAVFFSGEDTSLNISGEPDKIPVFNKEKDLIKFLKSNQNPISAETVNVICNLLK